MDEGEEEIGDKVLSVLEYSVETSRSDGDKLITFTTIAEVEQEEVDLTRNVTRDTGANLVSNTSCSISSSVAGDNSINRQPLINPIDFDGKKNLAILDTIVHQWSSEQACSSSQEKSW